MLCRGRTYVGKEGGGGEVEELLRVGRERTEWVELLKVVYF